MKYLAHAWKKPKESLGSLWKKKLVEYRKDNVVIKLDKPTRIDRARSLGYKAKQGFVVVRVRVGKGRRKRPKFGSGRRPKASGRFFSTGKSIQTIAEQRVSRKYPNLEVLNSYPTVEDGQYKWFECILVDPAHPSVMKDKDVKWITESQHKGRSYRGKTSAGRRGRGLHKKGTGSEKTRGMKTIKSK